MAAHPEDRSYCAHPPNVLPYIDTPIFISTSHQDSDAISVSAASDGTGDGYTAPCRPPASWAAEDQANLVPCFFSNFKSCVGRVGDFFKNWTDTITVRHGLSLLLCTAFSCHPFHRFLSRSPRPNDAHVLPTEPADASDSLEQAWVLREPLL